MPEQLRVGLGNLGGFQGLLSTSVWRIPKNWRQVGVGCGGRVGGSPHDRQQQQARSGMGHQCACLSPQSRIMITDIAALQLCAKTGLVHRSKKHQRRSSMDQFFGAECCGRGEQYLLVDQKNC
jgi:hypothetical protein